MSKEYILLGKSQLVSFDKKEDKEKLMQILGQYMQLEELDKCAKTVTEVAAEDGERIFTLSVVKNLVTEKITKDISVSYRKEEDEFYKFKRELHLEHANVTQMTYGVRKRFSFLPEILVGERYSDYEESLSLDKILTDFFHVIYTKKILFSEKELDNLHDVLETEDYGHVDLIRLVQFQYPHSLFIFEYNKEQKLLDIYFFEKEFPPEDYGYSETPGNIVRKVKAKELSVFSFESMF